MCKQTKHDTTYAAAQHILALKKRGILSKRKEVGIYPCSDCGKYHITTQIKKKPCIVKTA